MFEPTAQVRSPWPVLAAAAVMAAVSLVAFAVLLGVGAIVAMLIH
jgi:hypothetical protein